jgi:precorrin-4/cobalt-precorrin-4 C11-methyltransferase
MTARVYFIGAGPGDPELLTIKAQRIIKRADVIIFADSLINPEVCNLAKEGAEIHGSASLTLKETIAIISPAAKKGQTVARLQSGDPSIYGAIQEQMDLLDEQNIEYEIVPGVSSLFAAAAALRTELTIPEEAQTVIITRREGKTPVPAAESLKRLAEHHTTLVIFLSIAMAEQVQTELLAGGYAPDTPVAVVYRASWPDERVVRTILGTLAEEVRKSGISKQALILIGSFLSPGKKKARSKLYDESFEHGCR